MGACMRLTFTHAVNWLRHDAFQQVKRKCEVSLVRLDPCERFVLDKLEPIPGGKKLGLHFFILT